MSHINVIVLKDYREKKQAAASRQAAIDRIVSREKKTQKFLELTGNPDDYDFDDGEKERGNKPDDEDA